jgi:hypothetical protein
MGGGGGGRATCCCPEMKRVLDAPFPLHVQPGSRECFLLLEQRQRHQLACFCLAPLRAAGCGPLWLPCALLSAPSTASHSFSVHLLTYFLLGYC